MIAWSLDACLACGSVATVVATVPVGHEHGLGDLDRVVTVDGGATRAASVAAALSVVETEYVAIHDAARPLLTAALLDALVSELASAPGADAIIAAAPLTDTVKKVRGIFRVSGTRNAPRVDSAEVAETLDRSELWGAQTPQVFRTAALRAALAVDDAVRDAATDEAMLIEAAGGTVLLHDPGAPNLKVTTPLDLRVAEILLEERGRSDRG
jgi:2-C-methyl-D-erythritol 4-phosphate cytidylyltransferase